MRRKPFDFVALRSQGWKLAWLSAALWAIAPPLPGQATQSLPNDPGTATVTGTITDTDGALVEGATVTLRTGGVAEPHGTQTDSQGHFRLPAVAAGNITLSVTAKGLASASTAFTVLPGEVHELPAIALRVATASSEIMVTLAPSELAEEQVHVAEQQRVVGFIPNYFVSYNGHFVPLAARQKFGLGFHVVLDPTNFFFAGVAAGIEQANNTLPGYGLGAQGFGKRYGAALALSSSSTLFRGSIYPALFHQDPRYFYKGTGTVWQRARYALSTAVLCKGDSGHWQVNYSGILGDLSAGALANAYYPASSRNGAALTFENAGLSTVGVGVGHLLQEFLFKYVTTHARHAPSAQP